MTVEQKWDSLKTLLREMKSAVLAYSGGVDSSLLLKAASETLGPQVMAVTAASELYSPAELASAKEFAASLGVKLRVLRTAELQSEEFAQNPPERCYFCKRELFAKLQHLAEAEGIPFILDGSNTDDSNDYRPGAKAAEEFSVRSPLRETGFSKSDVRACAHMLNLPQWDKPALACLASRIPYGTRITPEILTMVQSAEDHLRSLGFRQVRVRHHGDMARIEIESSEFSRLLANGSSEKIIAALKKLGYTYVCMDLEGYRTGSMNEGLQKAGVRGQETGEG